MNQHALRFQQRFAHLSKRFTLLTEAMDKKELSQLEKTGLCQTTMFSFELFWKGMKDYLTFKGYTSSSPRDVLKDAFAEALIESEIWLDMLSSRNILSHTYQTEKIDAFTDKIREVFFPPMRNTFEILSQKYDEVRIELTAN